MFLDNVQYKKNEWQNRNKIKTPQGWQWITVPVKYKFPQKISEVHIENTTQWKRKHLAAIKTNYSKAPYFDNYLSFFEKLFSMDWEVISSLNIYLIKEIMEFLKINTETYISSELEKFPDSPDERLISLCKYFGANKYLAGAGGKGYMDCNKFKESGIEVLFQEYNHPAYLQLYGFFEPNMSIIDLLFNCGKDSLKILTGDK